MTDQIRKQEAAVEMIRMLVANKRSRPERLESAINELNRLKADHAAPAVNDPSGSAPRQSKKVAAIMKDANSDIFEVKQSALSQQATRLRADQSELSNMLHKVPTGQSCPDLVSRILALNAHIETLWDQKLFMQRNRYDGPAEPEHDQLQFERGADQVQTKAELSIQIQKLREKRSKLKKKLENPKASPGSRSSWELELTRTEWAIEEANQKRTVI